MFTKFIKIRKVLKMEVSKINSVKMATPQKVAFGKRETDVQERTEITGKDAFIGATILGSAILVIVGIKKFRAGKKYLGALPIDLRILAEKDNKSLAKAEHLETIKKAEAQIAKGLKESSIQAKAQRLKELKEAFAEGKKPLKRADVMAEMQKANIRRTA